MTDAQPLMAQQYAEVYAELKLPEYSPIPRGRSLEIALLVENPEEWARDFTVRIGRGTELRAKAKIDFAEMRKSLANEISQNEQLLKQKEIGGLYGATELLLCANNILKSSMQIYKNEEKAKKTTDNVPFRKILSNRPLTVVIFGTVQIRDIIEYGLESHAGKNLAKILSYRAFVDEYLSYLMPFDVKDLPPEPIATFEEIEEILGRRE